MVSTALREEGGQGRTDRRPGVIEEGTMQRENNLSLN